MANKDVRVVSRNNQIYKNDNFSEINSILSTFSQISQSSEANSVINTAFRDLVKTNPSIATNYQSQFYNAVFSSLNGTDVTSNLSYIPSGKTSRIVEYNRMAENSEIDACLDEIADNAINFNEKKQIIEIDFNEVEYIPDGKEGNEKREELERKKEIISKEFYKFLAPLKLKTKFFNYMKNFLKTGECVWENIIDPQNSDYGIVDFKFLPTHSFDFAYNKETLEKVGIWVKVLRTKTGASLNSAVNGSSSSVFGAQRGGTDLSQLNRFDDYNNGDLLFLPFSQITYVESNEHSPDELIVFPIIEKARRAFNQLMCTEDSIIIYRLARSPTRLVFNVGVGMANTSKGASELQKLIRKYNVSKSFNSSTGTTNNAKDPHTMTESFWFMKSANGEGTDVDELSSSIDMGELPDLLYFQKKIWAVFKIPFKTRFLEAETAYDRSPGNIGQDEYRFCKFIIRLLQCFVEGFKKSFITHLTLMGIWEKLDVDESFFDPRFVNPLSYELFEQSRVLAQRVEMYTSITEKDEFSKTLAMKKFLNMSAEDVDENWALLEEDMIKTKLIEARADAIVESEIETFKQQLENEKLAKEEASKEEEEYDTVDEIVDDALDTQKSQTAIELENQEEQQTTEQQPQQNTQQEAPQEKQQTEQKPSVDGWQKGTGEQE